MKKQISLALLSICVLFSAAVMAQEKEDKSKRPSPPAKAEGVADGAKIAIDYSKPSAKGRKMIGGNEPFGKVWRTGANAATKIKLTDTIVMEKHKVLPGEYSLFTKPGVNEWTVILNQTAQ